MHKTLSVVIPTLNEENGISDIIERVLAIEEPLVDVGVSGLELIVVDDGSQDRTAEIAFLSRIHAELREDGQQREA